MVSLVRSIISLASDFGLPANFEDWMIRSVLLLLVAWVPVLPGHKQPWCLPCRVNMVNGYVSSIMWKDLGYMHQLGIEKWWKNINWFSCYLKRSAQEAYEPHRDITETLWHLKLPGIWLFVQQFVQANNNGNINLPHYWPFVMGIH